MPRIVVGPFNRVEGDLEVALEVEGGTVREARVSSPLYRGYEQILEGRSPLDALVVVPRVCGICSVSQSSAAAAALAAASGAEAPPNGRLAANLVLACENVADHLTHFYLFFMPDLARAAYRDRPWYDRVAARFRAIQGAASAPLLAARAEFLGITGILAGRWPHTLSLQPGGSARPVQATEKIQLQVLLRSWRGYLERTVFGDELERVAAIASFDELVAWASSRPAGGSDLAVFLEVARDLGLERLGRASDAFMSYGAYAEEAGHAFARGVFAGGALRVLDPSAISEDVTHAFLRGDGARHPRDGETAPLVDKAGAYTWCKAPRLDGEVVEVGALARQVVDGHPLARDLVARAGGNVVARVVARLLEVALVVPRMQRWARDLAAGEPFFLPARMPDDADAAGLVEAARGSLGHWISVRNGRIARYQIVAPTTWNFSPRDAAGRPGPLEQALVGVGAADASSPAVQHVVRSFDPCLVCTVH